MSGMPTYEGRDEVSLESLLGSVGRAMSGAFSAGARMGILDWSTTVRRMPRRHDGANRYDLDYAPYQREMIETPFRDDVQATVYQLASRLGKTEVSMNIIGYHVCEAPRRILVMYPTISQAEKWSKETLQTELIEPTLPLREILGEKSGQRRRGNTILFKTFPGGLLHVFGSNAPGEARRAKGNLIFADEIDAIEQHAGDEGDILSILEKRGSEFPDTIFLLASYPSIKAKSQIQKRLELSDYRQFYFGCVKCGGAFVAHRDHITWPEGHPEKAEMLCPLCNAGFNDDQRMLMMRSAALDGQPGLGWVPTREFKGIAGFHGNAMLWPHPPMKGYKSFLHYAAQLMINVGQAENTERSRQVLVNTFDAEPYERETEVKPKPDRLLLRREKYNPAEMLPAEVLVLTCGVDVQSGKNARLELEIVGWGPDLRQYGIQFIKITGNPLESGVWTGLDEILERSWPHPSGVRMKIGAMAIDSAHKGDRVYAFAKPRGRRKVYAIRGSAQLNAQLIGNPTKRGKVRCPVYDLGTHEFKDRIYQQLQLDVDENTGVIPRGYMHYPQSPCYDEAYFKGLTIEDSLMKKGPDGEFYAYFEKPEGRNVRNEPLDTRVYAWAALKIWNPDLREFAKKLQIKGGTEEKAVKGPGKPVKGADGKTRRPYPLTKGGKGFAGRLRGGF